MIRDVLVSTIDPVGRGGVYTMANELAHSLRQWGREPSFFYLSASEEDNLSPRRLLRRGRLWGALAKTNRGLDGMAVGHVAAHFPSLAYVWWPYPVVRRHVEEFRSHVVLGSALAGHTVAKLRKPFWCWLSTLHEDELRAKAEVGDGNAQKTLKSYATSVHRSQELFVLNRARLIAAISKHTAERVATIYPEVAHKVAVIPVPVDTCVFHPLEKRSTNEAANDSKRVLWVGRPDDPRKNIQMLLSAFQRISDKVPNVRLTLVGSGVNQLSEQLDRLGIKDIVELRPSVKTSEQLAAIYRQSKVFVLSSRQEGLGIVVHEAMASGMPVVSTRCGGPEEAVRDGQTGYLVSLDDPLELADRVVRLLEDDVVQSRMGECARERAASEWSRQAIEPLLLWAFQQVSPGFRPML